MSRHGHRDWSPGPPPQLSWWWGPGPQGPAAVQTPTAAGTPTTPATPLRIGDAERDQAISDLGDHFAAGRLSREEFDERSDQAMQARFSTDLTPLFADLPRATDEPAQPWPPGPPRPFAGPPPIAVLLVPLLVVAVVAGAILAHAPFLLWLLVWFVVIGKLTGHRRRHRRQHQQLSRPGWW